MGQGRIFIYFFKKWRGGGKPSISFLEKEGGVRVQRVNERTVHMHASLSLVTVDTPLQKAPPPVYLRFSRLTER